MAQKIRGITVEIGGDTSGLDKALSNTNKEIKSTQSQLKDVERLLKLDPKNTELLAQKHKLLNDAVTETRKKLDTLRQAEQELKNSGVDENSSQFMALKREIIFAENELENLTKAANESNSVLSKIGDTADKISSGAQKVSKATAALSGAAAASLGGIVSAGVAAAAAADDYNTLAKQTGLSTETLQQAKYAADLIDVSYETVTGSLNKMVGKLRTNEKGFEELGIATRDAGGDLLNMEEIFWNAVDVLSNIENETERDIAAQELFGKSAADLAGIIDDGGESFRRLGQEAKDAGLIMSQETLDSLNGVNDQLDTLKANASATLSVSGAKALEAIVPVLEEVTDKVSEVLDWLGSLDEAQITTIMTVLAVIAAISPVAGIIGAVSSAVSNCTSIINSAWPVISGIGTKIFEFVAANPIALIAAAIVALVVLIATKGDEIQAILQKVDDFLQGVFAKDWSEQFGAFGEVLNAFFANVKNIWDAIKKVFDGIINFVRGVFTGDWKRAWEGVKQIFSGVFGAFTAIAKAPLNAVIGLLNGLISGVNSLIGKLNGIHITAPDWVTKLTGIGSFGFNLGYLNSIPYLAKGGILSQGSAIVGEAGPELLTMAAGKAVVQPLTNNNTNNTNYGGVTLNIYGSEGQDVRELADIIMNEIQCATDRKGSVFA